MTNSINKLGKLLAIIMGGLGILLAAVGSLMAFAVVMNGEFFILLGLVVPFMAVFMIVISLAWQAIFRPSGKSTRNIAAFYSFIFGSLSMAMTQAGATDTGGETVLKKALAAFIIFMILPFYYLLRAMITSPVKPEE